MTGLVGLTSALQLSQAQEVMAADKKNQSGDNLLPCL